MFFGLFILWPSLLSPIPLVAIPGYARVAKIKEQLLFQGLGEHCQYREKAGRFIHNVVVRLGLIEDEYSFISLLSVTQLSLSIDARWSSRRRVKWTA